MDRRRFLLTSLAVTCAVSLVAEALTRQGQQTVAVSGDTGGEGLQAYRLYEQSVRRNWQC
jgi:hypothetical protein